MLVEVDGLADAMALHRALRASPPPGTVDLVPAARTVLVRVTPGTDLRAVADAIRSARPMDVTAGATAGATTGATKGDAGDATARDVEIPVVYDGDDLHEVARRVGLSPRDVVAAHTGQVWTVAFAGFAPGFGYLVGENDRLQVPRREASRTRVPAGSVGLAGAFSGVYPRASPGGWQLIGRTDVAVWDLDREPPALLTPGTRVRFTERAQVQA